ncbi:hypothetical protein [Lentzea atacamensis]|uniref:hypothetical protein n=1 Tax=Lentzea atacamensis TaxID=531938 RepID=UPI0038995C7D
MSWTETARTTTQPEPRPPAGGVQFGQYCSPVGATTRTSDGRPAKCYMGKDGKARWGYHHGG